MVKSRFIIIKNLQKTISAYDVTIHKFQGLSIDCAIVDLYDEVFSAGVAYVTLLRVRSQLKIMKQDPHASSSTKKEKRRCVVVVIMSLESVVHEQWQQNICARMGLQFHGKNRVQVPMSVHHLTCAQLSVLWGMVTDPWHT